VVHDYLEITDVDENVKEARQGDGKNGASLSRQSPWD
jgi:hypothetical protein